MAGKKGMKHRMKPELLRSPSMIEKWRSGVRAGMIRERLDKQALGELKNKVGKPIQMTPAELKAAEMLLARCIPTVSAVEITGKDGGPVESRVTFYMPKNGRD